MAVVLWWRYHRVGDSVPVSSCPHMRARRDVLTFIGQYDSEEVDR